MKHEIQLSQALDRAGFTSPSRGLLPGAFILTILVFSGCSVTRPMLTEAEVISIAAKAAAAEGFRLDDYQEPKARYEVAEKDKTWTVFYQGKVLLPGHHFSVSVHDRTKQTNVMRGQ